MNKDEEVSQLRQEGMSFEEIQRWYNAYDDDSGLLAGAEVQGLPTIYGAI
jgi:hypothetical protein